MCKASDNAHKTATTRSKLSAPARYLSENNLLQGRCLDYGCGKGFDCDTLGFDGFDPFFREDLEVEDGAYDTIMCNFVLNVLQDEAQQLVLRCIERALADDGVAYISVRNDKKNLNGYTSIGTYQTFVDLDLPVVTKTSSFVMYKLEKKNA